MIQVKNLRKKFGELTVLNGIDLHIDSGEVSAIIGPSGSGKSTALRCLINLEKADDGDIIIDGNSICLGGKYKKDKEIASHLSNVGMVFQNFNLFPHLSVKENLVCAPLLLKRDSRKSVELLCEQMLIKVGLLDKMYEMPNKLSGGQKQRVAIARALMLNPSILLFDEPTSALDPELTQEVLEVIRNLAKEKITMIIVTHEIGFAKEASDTVFFMDNGLVVEYGKAKELIENPVNERTKAFLQKIY